MTEYYTRAGTVTVASGSTSVTGSGTSFLDLLPGALIWLGTQTMPNVVASVASNTALTLEYASTGAVTGGAYVAVNVPGSQQAVALIAQLYASIGTAVDVTTAEKRVRLGTQTGEAMIYWSDDTIGSAANFRWRAGFLAGAQDVWRIQRSANGTTWTDALTINRTTGVISIAGVTVTTGQITDAGATGILSMQAATQADGRTAIGAAPIASPTFTGAPAIDGGASSSTLNLFGPAGQIKQIRASTGASLRWSMGATAAAESGSNAGTNWALFSYDDTGSLLRTDLSIARNTGEWSIGGNFRPATNNATSLGLSTHRFSAVWGVNLNISGTADITTLNVSGATTTAAITTTGAVAVGGTLSSTGNLTVTGNAFIGDPNSLTQMVFQGAAGQLRSLFFRSGATNRWELRCDNTAESGSTAGSDFSVFRYGDAGGSFGSMLTLRRSDGAFLLPGLATTASAANAFIDSANSNRLLRSTSSAAYKRDIETLEFWRADAFLAGARPVWYRSKSEVDNPEWGYYGFIAEEIAAINPALVVWGYQADQYETVEWDEERTWTEGEGDDAVTRTEVLRQSERRLKPGEQMRPDGVMYDRLTVFLTAIAQDQAAKIAALEAANADMAARLLAIEGRLAAAGI